jgi:hypothetical protein
MLCLLLVEGKKRIEKKRKGQGAFFPGKDTPCWLCHAGYFWQLGTIKRYFKGQSLNFMCT